MGDSTRTETPEASTVCKVIITINTGNKEEKEEKKEGGKGKGGTAADRRKLIVSINKRFPRSLIFCQEISGVKIKFKKEVVEKCGPGVYEYAHTGKEAAVMWRRDDFESNRQFLNSTDPSIVEIVKMLQRTKPGVDVSEVHTRTAMVKLKCRRTKVSFLAVSWHGPHSKKSEEDKKKAFNGLICFLREVCKIKELALSSFIIGGDFNLDTRKIEYEGVKISGYKLCARDENRNEKEKKRGGQFIPYKDTFIVSATVPSDKRLMTTMTVDLTESSVKPYDLESEISKDPLLDHVPVVGELVCTSKPFMKQDRGKQTWNGIFRTSCTFRPTFVYITKL